MGGAAQPSGLFDNTLAAKIARMGRVKPERARPCNSKRSSITSSSARDLPGACWPTASAPTGARVSCCSKPAARTATRGSTYRPAFIATSTIRRSPGSSRPSRSLSSPAAACRGRAARCWAGRARSTASFTSAASARISICGASSAAPAGRMTTMLPYFRRAENQGAAGEDQHHGKGGPLDVVTDLRAEHELYDAFITAAVEAGYRRNHDFNGLDQDGVGPLQVTVRNKRRCSAAVAYLRPALKRINLKVEIRALAQRVLFDGRRAVGLEYAQGGVVRQAGARREVILAGGSINSPQLLQLSGVGPGEFINRQTYPGRPRSRQGRREFAGPPEFARRLPRAPRQHPERNIAQLAAASSRRARMGARSARRLDDGGGADRPFCAHPPRSRLARRAVPVPRRQLRQTRRGDARFPRLPVDLHPVPPGKPRLAPDPLALSGDPAGNPAQLSLDPG